MSGRHFAQRPAWLRYAVAIGCVEFALLGREALTPGVGPTALPFIFFFPAVAVAAWFGGIGPGILAVALSALAANWFFTMPLQAFSIASTYDLLSQVAFVMAAILIVAGFQAMHIARRRLVDEVAERKRAETELNKARDLLATTVASIGDAVIVTDEKGAVTFLNPEAERLTGWKNSEANGQPLPKVFVIVNEQTLQPVENPAEKVFRSGKVTGLANHTLVISKGGERTPIGDSAAPIRHADGRLLGVVLVFRDVTAQRNSQEAAEQLAAIVEHSGDAILTKNLDGIVQTWNPGAERLFGYRAEEIVGKPITILYPPDRLYEEDQIIDNLLKGRSVEWLETIRVAKDGRRIPVAESVSPLKDAEGEIIGASKIVHDISDIVAAREALTHEQEALRDAQQKLSRYTAELEATVAERTAKLQETVNDLQSFSYTMAHDMRAPLRAMGTFAQLLMEDMPTANARPETKMYCERIIVGAARLDNLIKDALNYTKASLQEFPLQEVGLSELMHGLIDTYPNLHAENTDISISDPLPIVLGNESLLTQCFSNLLGNAVKFVRPGVRPNVRVWSEAKGGFARIRVEDNGIGIPEHAQPRLFAMFQKLDTQYEGTGIGLAIVRKAVERMGGKVGVESQQDHGSRF